MKLYHFMFNGYGEDFIVAAENKEAAVDALRKDMLKPESREYKDALERACALRGYELREYEAGEVLSIYVG